MTWDIEFSSDKFLPTLPEDCQAHPGVYGFELALWLAQALCRQGIVTGYPSADDWGWCLDYAPTDAMWLTIACASTCAAEEGYCASRSAGPYRSANGAAWSSVSATCRTTRRWKTWAGRSSTCCGPNGSPCACSLPRKILLQETVSHPRWARVNSTGADEGARPSMEIS